MAVAIAVSAALILISMALVWVHLRSLRGLPTAEADPARHRFGRRQFRRRVLASGIIGMIGIAILASPFVLDPTAPVFGYYWLALLVSVALLFGLALLDLWDSHVYFRELRRQLWLAREAALTDSGPTDDAC